MENEIEDLEPEVQEEEIDSEVTPEVTEEVKETPQARAARLTRMANQARKKLGLNPLGEAHVKIVAPELEPEPLQTFSTKDAMALMKANVEEEDIGDVEEWAKFKKISIAEALKSTQIKTLLSEKAEQRKTSEVTNTQPSRRSTPKQTPEEMRSKIDSGDYIPQDEKEIAAAYEAKRQEALNKNKR